MQTTVIALRHAPRFARLFLGLTIAATVTACAGGSGGTSRPAGLGSSGAISNPPPASTAGLLETTLGGAGSALDLAVPLDTGKLLGNVGKSLDGVGDPLESSLMALSSAIGSATSLGRPLDSALDTLGGSVGRLGETLKRTDLPGGLGSSLGGLSSGLGETVSRAGGVLHATADTTRPLSRVTESGTHALGKLTSVLGPGGEGRGLPALRAVAPGAAGGPASTGSEGGLGRRLLGGLGGAGR